MDDEHDQVGRVHQYERPDWRPLARAVGEELLPAFMWMHEVVTPAGGRLHAYKHVDTRRYVHLDVEGRAFLYVNEGRYRPVALATALDLALRPWWEQLDASPEDVAAAVSAIERARRSAEPCAVNDDRRGRPDDRRGRPLEDAGPLGSRGRGES